MATEYRCDICGSGCDTNGQRDGTVRVYVTKYALESGIVEREVGDIDHEIAFSAYNQKGYYLKPYWHLTREGAVAHAEQLRIKKIEKLKAQLAKMESLKFE